MSWWSDKTLPVTPNKPLSVTPFWGSFAEKLANITTTDYYGVYMKLKQDKIFFTESL